ncbi:hypothetical protein OUZ56_003378 [Daphnia magna]|uniref:Uncharacterized protein n=1 Tax=Daphnia magna TaxID=35525 RepID=A0ABR0A8L1_9CRUS|nr:hypothetical protein OUZ56_003378 [Daphnia magna]
MLFVEEQIRYYVKQYGSSARNRKSSDGVVGDIVSGILYEESRHRGYICDNTIPILICVGGANPYERSSSIMFNALTLLPVLCSKIRLNSMDYTDVISAYILAKLLEKEKDILACIQILKMGLQVSLCGLNSNTILIY